MVKIKIPELLKTFIIYATEKDIDTHSFLDASITTIQSVGNNNFIEYFEKELPALIDATAPNDVNIDELLEHFLNATTDLVSIGLNLRENGYGSYYISDITDTHIIFTKGKS